MRSKVVSSLFVVAAISSANVLPNSLSLSCSCLARVSCLSDEKFRQAIGESVNVVLRGCDNVRARDVAELRLSFVRGGFTRSLSDFTSLKDLKFSHSHLGRLSTDFLVGLSALTKLSLDGNEIDELEEFQSLESLEKLFLANNRIEVIREETFGNLPSLTFLTLEQNKISLVQPKSLAANRLMELNLNRNDLRVLDAETFQGNPKLKELSINHNHLTDLPDEMFSGNLDLEVLRLHGNNLRKLQKNLFRRNRKLRWVELGENELQFIDPLALTDLKQLQLIDLISNDCIDGGFPVDMNFVHLIELTKRNCHFLAVYYFDLAFH